MQPMTTQDIADLIFDAESFSEIEKIFSDFPVRTRLASFKITFQIDDGDLQERYVVQAMNKADGIKK